MDSFFKVPLAEPVCAENSFVQEGIEKCPFLRNINEPTHFSFSSSSFPSARGAKGPIFEDGPEFETAFKLFHGQNGVLPLVGRSFPFGKNHSTETTETDQKFNPLAAKAATISLSAFGSGGPFSFDSFSKKFNNKTQKPSNYQPIPEKLHEATTNEWLETGQCPLAKSFRAVSGVVPLVTSLIKLPPGLKLKCPQAIVAARAAISKTEYAKNLRPKPLHYKILSIALLGMAVNVPLGVWRAHCTKFSVQWFLAIHAAVPFIGMLRKCILMPKAAMAFTLAASILGQTIGSRAEKIRIRMIEEKRVNSVVTVEKMEGEMSSDLDLGFDLKKRGNCGEIRGWDAIPMKMDGSSGTNNSPICV